MPILPFILTSICCCCSPVGYNGAYGVIGSGMTATMAARNATYGDTRPDGMPWVLPENVHPYRFYLGVKGLMEDGSPAPESDFLARNGLRYGQIYGFAIDMTAESGPTGGKWRDEAHKGAPNGLTVPGHWVAQPWRWNGTVVDFQHDGSWDFQLPVPGDEFADYRWWNSAGYDAAGAKCEHLSPVCMKILLLLHETTLNTLLRTPGLESRGIFKDLLLGILVIATLRMFPKFSMVFPVPTCHIHSQANM